MTTRKKRNLPKGNPKQKSRYSLETKVRNCKPNDNHMIAQKTIENRNELRIDSNIE